MVWQWKNRLFHVGCRNISITIVIRQINNIFLYKPFRQFNLVLIPHFDPALGDPNHPPFLTHGDQESKLLIWPWRIWMDVWGQRRKQSCIGSGIIMFTACHPKLYWVYKHFRQTRKKSVQLLLFTRRKQSKVWKESTSKKYV